MDSIELGDQKIRGLLLSFLLSLFFVICFNYTFTHLWSEENVKAKDETLSESKARILENLEKKWLEEKKRRVFELGRTFQVGYLVVEENYAFIILSNFVIAHRRFEVPPQVPEILDLVIDSILYPDSHTKDELKPRGLLFVPGKNFENVSKELSEGLRDLGIELIVSAKLTTEEIDKYMNAPNMMECCISLKMDKCCLVCGKSVSNIKRCDSCKGVYYCSMKCAKDDISGHRKICNRIKADIQEGTAGDARDFFFSYSSGNNILYNIDIPKLLIEKKCHGVGLYKTLCVCYRMYSPSYILRECLNKIVEEGIVDPAEKLKIFGLSEEWQTNILKLKLDNYPKLSSWKDLYSMFQASNSDTTALIIGFPMTIWHILTKYILPDIEPDENGIKNATLHILNIKLDISYIFLFKVVAALLPKTKLSIFCFINDPSFDEELSPNLLFIPCENNSSMFVIAITKQEYTPDIYNKSSISDSKTDESLTPPDAIVVLSDELETSPYWPKPEWSGNVQAKQKVILVTYNKPQAVSHLACTAELLPLESVDQPELNPFRHPARNYCREILVPSWRYGYITNFRVK